MSSGGRQPIGLELRAVIALVWTREGQQQTGIREIQRFVVHYLAVFVYLGYVPSDYFVLILNVLQIHVVAHYRTRGRAEEGRYRRGEQQRTHSHAAAPLCAR